MTPDRQNCDCVHAKRAEWRPIAEVHEDIGPVVVIDIRDPGSVSVEWPPDIDLDTCDWTHFAELPLLTNEVGKALRKAYHGNT